MAAVPPYSRLSKKVVVVDTLGCVGSNVAMLLSPPPLALGFDLEFTSDGHVALIQLSSEKVTCLFHVALFKRMFLLLLSFSAYLILL